MAANDSGAPPTIVDGSEVTIEGEVIVDEPVKFSADRDRFYESAPRPALVVWRIRRGTKAGNGRFSAIVGANGNWKTYESGIDAGSFRIDDGTREIRVDLTWLTERHGDAGLESFETSHLEGHGPWSKHAWNSPYVQVDDYRDEFTLDEKPALPPEVRAEIGDDLDGHQLQLRLALEGESLTVHGQLSVDQGTPVLRGTDDVPMSLSDQGPAVLERHVRYRMVKTGVYALGLLAFSAIVLYASVGPSLL